MDAERPLGDKDVDALADGTAWITLQLSEIRSLAQEVQRRRKAMAYADDLGIDVDAVARLICPPPCEACKGRGIMGGPGGYYDTPERGKPCPDCHGRSQHTLYDRLNALRDDLNARGVDDNLIDDLAAIIADLAKPGVTP